MYRQLAEAYGWTPDQVNRLTLFQAAMYFGAIGPEHGRVKMNAVESNRYLQHQRKLRRR